MAGRGIPAGHARGAVAAIVIALLAGPAGAQVADRFITAERENAIALRRYTWTSRTEVRQAGETKSVQLHLVRYGFDGQPQRTPIGGTAPAQPPRRPLLRKIAERKTEEARDRVEALQRLAEAYASLGPRAMAFIQRARVMTPLAGGSDSVEVHAADVLKPGDSITIWIDPVTHQRRRALIHTVEDGKPVVIDTEFRRLPDGPVYAARVSVHSTRDALEVVSEAFDHAL